MGAAAAAPRADPFAYTPAADPFSGWLKTEAAPADPRLQTAATDPRLQAAVADPRLQAAVADPRLQAAAADPRRQTAAQASCAAALLGAGFAGSCAGVQAGGGQWDPYGCSTGGAGFGAWGGDARGATAAAANDAGGVPEAPPPNPHKKVVTDEDLDGLDL